MNRLSGLGLMLFTALLVNTTFAQEKSVTVGGAPMYPSKNIVAGPFTVFAPTDAAFDNGVILVIDTVLMPK
jgi:uncharacterized surface protein with fasciclin (FAS1) repeats